MHYLLALLFAISMAFSGITIAEGGKNKNPHLDDEVCVVGNTDACEEVPAPPQSGIQVYICDGVEIACVVEPEDDEEESPGPGRKFPIR